MESYNKTIWENDETYLNEVNMNKIENQLEVLTNNAINQDKKGYVTNDELNGKKYASENFVSTAIKEAIGTILEGSY